MKKILMYCETIDIRELYDKYDSDVITKKLNNLFRKYPDNKRIRISEKTSMKKFIEYYNSLDDFEKQRYVNINYHPIPFLGKNEQSHLGEPWVWVLDIKYRVKKVMNDERNNSDS